MPRTGFARAARFGVALGVCWMAATLAREAGRRFEAHDAREAIALVRAYAAPRGELLRAVARDAHTDESAALDVRAESVSLAYRHARVWVRPGVGASYAFDVDLGERSIHPGNPAAERVLRALLAPPAP